MTLPKEGYWRSGAYSPNILQCPFEDACKGNSTFDRMVRRPCCAVWCCAARRCTSVTPSMILEINCNIGRSFGCCCC